MVFETVKKTIRRFEPLLAFERVFHHPWRLNLKKIFFWLSLILFIIASDIVVAASDKLSGLFFLSFSIFLLLTTLDAFYYSLRFSNHQEPYSFDLAEIISHSKKSDLVGGFIRSETGKAIFKRLGFDRESLRVFLEERRTLVSSQSISFGDTHIFTSYLRALFSADQEFSHLLVSRGIDEEGFLECALWVVETRERREAKERFWSRDRLESIPSLGRDWAYGKAHSLMQASTPLRFSPYQNAELHQEEILRLESALSRGSEANAHIIGEEGVGKLEVVEGLARRILRQKSPAHLRDKHIFVLDLEHIAAMGDSGAEFERLILSLFEEASYAGNTIVVIPDLPSLLEAGEARSVDITTLLARFLLLPTLHIVAVSDTDAFDRVVKGNHKLSSHMEEIRIQEGGERSVLRTLEEVIMSLEKEGSIFFTYPALTEAVRSAKRYFVDAPLLDTATDLLVESQNKALDSGRSEVLREDVLVLVEEKTGIPTSGITPKEQDTLLRLEELLHERVVGQEEAISAIASSLRRARSGLTNPDRPMGSFLFLGPTGVGKTETAKALSEVFFGVGAPLLRLDMSEYNTSDSLNRLIGAFDSETPGSLSSLLRDHPYGVLLLDEFEKTDSRVLDLFLQILDEGMFTDALGRKISARNTIIVATSNAGSVEIFKTVKRGENLKEKQEEILNSIISEGMFKPELLNRFDGTILFHPLEEVHLTEVAKHMLEGLSWRLRAKGMALVVTPDLVQFLVKHGSDPEFGARPLNRVIQDKVESVIAEGIISGVYKNGSKIELHAKDLT
jgi:ATP-dependent Clp protease ATP-binding subunit ClpC